MGVVTIIVLMFPVVPKLVLRRIFLTGIQVCGKEAKDVKIIFLRDPLNIKWRRAAACSLERFFVDCLPLIAKEDFFWIGGIANDGFKHHVISS